MSNLHIWLLIVLVIALAGCRPEVSQRKTIAELHGRSDGKAHRKLTQQAIEEVNVLLGNDFGFKLWADWTEKPATADLELIPVSLLAGETGEGPAFVPTGERIIFVQDGLVPRLPTLLTNGVKDGVSKNTQRLLAICLLHECGHIALHSDGAVVRPGQVELNGIETFAKKREMEADQFAADVLKKAATEHFPSTRFSTAIMLQTELVGLNWDLGVGQMVDRPLGEEIFRPGNVFHERSYTHANIQLRFMILENLVHPTPAGTEAIERFMEGRKRADEAASPYRLMP